MFDKKNSLMLITTKKKKKRTSSTACGIPVTHSPHTICAQRIEAAQRHTASEKMNKKESGSRSWRLLLPPPTITALEMQWHQGTMVSQGTKALHTGPASPLTSVPLPSPLLAQPPGWLNKCSGHLSKGWQVRLCH